MEAPIIFEIGFSILAAEYATIRRSTMKFDVFLSGMFLAVCKILVVLWPIQLALGISSAVSNPGLSSQGAIIVVTAMSVVSLCGIGLALFRARQFLGVLDTKGRAV